MLHSRPFDRVVDELHERNYDPLVHVPDAHSETYSDVLDRCQRHEITIRGRYPDENSQGIRLRWELRNTPVPSMVHYEST